MIISISGYQNECICQHCNRNLKHGIVLSDGRIVGATCFATKLTEPKTDRNNKKYRDKPDTIIHLAKLMQYRDSDYHYRLGYMPSSFQFSLA